MIARALLAAFLLPGIFVAVLPWVLAAHDPWRAEGPDAAAAIVGLGIGIYILCIRDFLVIGRGIPRLRPWIDTKGG